MFLAALDVVVMFSEPISSSGIAASALAVGSFWPLHFYLAHIVLGKKIPLFT